MADSLPLTASVSSLLAVGLHVSHITSQISDTRSAPRTIRSLSLELNTLCKILDNLDALPQNSPLQSETFPAQELLGLLENIMGDFQHLQTIVGAHTAEPTEGTLKQRWKQSLWVFRDTSVLELKRNIEAYKASLNLTLTVTEFAGASRAIRTSEELRKRMDDLTAELAEVRVLCQRLKRRRGVFSAFLHRVSSHSGSRPKPLSQVATNEISANRNGVSSSHQAASSIELYCSKIESDHKLFIQQTLTRPNPPPNGPSVSRDVGPHQMITQPSRELITSAPTPTRFQDHFTPSSAPEFIEDWPSLFPQPPPNAFVPVIIPTSDPTDNKYRFSGMLFYPAPELVPAVFARRPPRDATVGQKDEYVRRCVEANAAYAFSESRKASVDGMDVKRSLGLMKLFWRQYALYKVDPQIDGSFTSPALPPINKALLHIYGFTLPADPIDPTAWVR